MSDPQSLSRRYSLVQLAIRIMLLVGMLAIGFVIIQTCSQGTPGLSRYADGPLKRLVVLTPVPDAPTLSFQDVDGQNWQISDFRGQPVLLNVWATWCTPCVKEMPMLDDLQARYAGQMKIIAVSMDRDIVEAESFYNSKSIQSLGLYHDESLSMASKLGVDGLPVSVFYSASGREIARISGDVDWNDPIIDAFLAEIYDFGG